MTTHVAVTPMRTQSVRVATTRGPRHEYRPPGTDSLGCGAVGALPCVTAERDRQAGLGDGRGRRRIGRERNGGCRCLGQLGCIEEQPDLNMIAECPSVNARQGDIVVAAARAVLI